MSTVLNKLGALEAARLLNRRELSAEQLIRACLARIEQREPQLQAWATLDAEAAIARAKVLDRGPVRGVLHGLPLGVKDIFDTHDLPTRYGSSIYERHQPDADAACVALCRDAGVVVPGKTVTTEFATYTPGPTHNPRNLAYTPGGSSSGSAAAVGDDMVPLALGTQTAGSIIRPAAYCGIVGFKPSFGRVPRAGMKNLADSLDTIGGFARSVEDVGLLASVLMRDPRLLKLDYDGKPRIGMFRSQQWRHTQPESRIAFEHAARVLSAAGAHVQEMPMPVEDCMVVQLHADIMSFEASMSLAYERHTHGVQLSMKLQAVLDAGAGISTERYLTLRQHAARLSARTDAWFDDYDILLAPSAAGEAPFFEQGTGDPQFCRGWTLAGVPTVHLPFAHGPQGLPVGLQAVGRANDDHRLLSIANWVQALLAEHPPEM
ncbi:amidase [Bordetella ansorpii]|uniref:Amidase n=1 Tax=Bordetella ansorpii TaxID=288768 RepID=A0A157S9G2_9BORD|nr:amidase [Bordetella ansorpii]SAI66566.1 amidase [Bordetella ansorpii]